MTAHQSSDDDGFTLVEILVAIVLVGILSAVAIIGISSLTDKGHASACSASLDAAKTSSLAYFTNHSAYPTSIAAMTSGTPPEFELGTGITVSTDGTKAVGDGWTLTLTPGAAGAAPTFACTTGAAATAAANAIAASPNGTTACPGTFAGWSGEYYANTNLTGAPALCRDDAAVNFDWGNGSPGAGVPADLFSVRWSKTQNFSAGSHTFTVGSDDGVRVYIDGTVLIDNWGDRSYATNTATRTLTAGNHFVVYEFYENGGQARATLAWT